MDPLEQLRESLYKSEESKCAAENLLKKHSAVHSRHSAKDPAIPDWVVAREHELQELIGQVERQRTELQLRTEARVALVVPWLDDHLLKNHLQRLRRELDSVRNAWLMEYHLARGGRRPENWQSTFQQLSQKFFDKSKQEIKDWDERWRPFPWERNLPTLEQQSQQRGLVEDTELEESIIELNSYRAQNGIKSQIGHGFGDNTVEVSTVDATYPGDDVDLVSHFMNKLRQKEGNGKILDALDGDVSQETGELDEPIDEDEPMLDEGELKTDTQPLSQYPQSTVEILSDTPSPEQGSQVVDLDEEQSEEDEQEFGDDSQNSEEDVNQESLQKQASPPLTSDFYSGEDSGDEPSSSERRESPDFEAMHDIEDVSELDDDDIDNVELDLAELIPQHDPTQSLFYSHQQSNLVSGGEYERLIKQDPESNESDSLVMIDQTSFQDSFANDTQPLQHERHLQDSLQQFASAALDGSNTHYYNTTDNTMVMMYPETTADDSYDGVKQSSTQDHQEPIVEEPQDLVVGARADSSIASARDVAPAAASVVDLLSDDDEKISVEDTPHGVSNGAESPNLGQEGNDLSGSRGVSPSPGVPIAISEQEHLPSAFHLKDHHELQQEGDNLDDMVMDLEEQEDKPEREDVKEEELKREGSKPAQTEGPLRINFGFDITANFDEEHSEQSEQIQTGTEVSLQDNMDTGESVQPEQVKSETHDGATGVYKPPTHQDLESDTPAGYREVSMHDMDVSFNIVPDFDNLGPTQQISPAGEREASSNSSSYLDNTAMLVRSASKIFGKSPLFGGRAPERIYHSTPAPQQRALHDPRTMSQSAKRVFSQSPLFSGKPPIQQPDFGKPTPPHFNSITKARFKMNKAEDAKFVHPVVVDTKISAPESEKEKPEPKQLDLKERSTEEETREEPAELKELEPKASGSSSSELPVKKAKSPQKSVRGRKPRAVKKEPKVERSAVQQETTNSLEPLEPTAALAAPELVHPDQPQLRRSPRKLSDHIPGARSSSPNKRNRSPSRKTSGRAASGPSKGEVMPSSVAEPESETGNVKESTNEADPEIISQEASQPESPTASAEDTPLKVARSRPKRGAKRKADSAGSDTLTPAKKAKQEPTVRRSSRLQKK